VSETFAQSPSVTTRNFHLVSKGSTSQGYSNQNPAISQNPVTSQNQNYAPRAQAESSPADSGYVPYEEPDFSSDPNYISNQHPENIFNNPDYVPDHDPALLTKAGSTDETPKTETVPEVNNNHKLIKTDNPRSTMFLPLRQTPNRAYSADLSKPEVFVNSNNLIRKTGSFYQARGEVIAIEGKVTDSFGVPIEGAIIEIWQTNSAGKYQNLLEKNSRFMDVYFNMSGRAVTDNLGNYSFLTIMPGSYLDRAPHINMNIYHEQFGRIETEFYFDKHPKNELDYQYLSYNEDDRKLLTASVELSNKFDKDSYKRCYFNIVMNGVHKYKSFGTIF